MRIIGLTGSIGMGKSTAAARLRQHGIAVFDADAHVHQLYAGPLAAEIETAFPGTTTAEGVDRRKLSEALLAAPERFAELEAIVHPRVRTGQADFLKGEFRRGADIAFLEIPLLFESGVDARVDATVVVSAEPAVQRKRVLERQGMTGEKLDAILRRQWPDARKRASADFVVDTSGSIAACEAQIDAILLKLNTVPAQAYERHWAH